MVTVILYVALSLFQTSDTASGQTQTNVYKMVGQKVQQAGTGTDGQF